MVQTVRDVMTADPVTVAKDAPLVEAARLMRDRGIGDVIVTDGDMVQGIVTDRDIVVRGVADGGDPSQMRVDEVVSGEVATVSPDDPVDRAVHVMRDRAVRRLPVVESGKAVGVVSLGDLAMERDPDSALADISEEPPTR